MRIVYSSEIDEIIEEVSAYLIMTPNGAVVKDSAPQDIQEKWNRCRAQLEKEYEEAKI